MPRRRRSLGRGGHKRSRSATLSSQATPGPSGQLSQTTVEAFETENTASEQPIESLSDTEAVDTAKHLAEAEIEAGSYVLLPIKFHNSTAVVNFDFENMGGGHKLPPGAVEARYPLRPTKPKGKLIPKIYKDRIESFYKEGQYEKYNLRAMMFEGAAVGDKYVQLSSWAAPDLTRPKFKEATSHKFEPAKVGDWFGPSWATHWFKIEVTVPSELRDKERLEFHWDADTEGMVWSQGGDPLQGLTGGGERVEWILPDSFRDGKSHTFYIEMACNGMFGTGEGIQPPDPNKQFKLKTADIVAVNLQARGLYIDSWIIGDAAREFPENSRQQHQALVVINRIIDTFELGNKDSIIECRKIAQEYIGKHVDSAKVYQSGTTPEVFGVGHCHIDTCWLWPWAETRRKTARSWTNQCNLMEQYPELNFVVSQAQQYKWLKEDYPYVYERLSKKVKEGQFHPIGGSWVEHDTNMPSGESLVRQFLYGQRFFEGHFGKRCETFWLPDTFGYSSQLPQLCRLAGMGRFLTQKLSWNNINNFPHTSFNWVALDGTQVLCHMPPSETYTADAHFGDVKRSIEKHKSMDADHTSLLVFGKGDGGGGPTWEHLEKLRRCRGMADTVGLLPTVHMGNNVDDFFAQLETKADKLPTWSGELYFELHRGTYTTQANNKLNNRKGEFILRDIEMLATFASLKDNSFKYPKKEIDFMWEAVLLCQFHDCLPGSSIEMCYDDSDELYAEVFKTAKRVLNDIYKALGVSDQPAIAGATEVALNTLPWHRCEVIDTADGKGAIASGAGNLLTLRPIQVAGEPAVSIKEVNKGVFVMQNDQLRVQIEDGVITSLFDRKADREVLAKGGKANQYVIFDDKPLYWQAWDVEVFHLESRKELASGPSEISEDKGHRVSVVTKTKISELSSLVTTISLSAAIEGELSSVEVTCDVDWHESMKFLKVEFPVDITNDEASYETQYGLVRRPTHYNTTWDMAKFEVCCHKFADLSEHGYGVSVLNDSKYGFATSGNVMRLSLLRSPKAPDAHADMGAHHIRWAILPHAGRLGAATVRKGYEFNNKLKVLSAPDLQAVAATGLLGKCPVHLAGDASLVLDCVKRGEDDEDVGRDEGIPRRKGRSVVLRVYDSLGGRSRGVVETSYDVRKVFKTNVLEDDLEEVPVDEHGRFAIELHAFEVATYRLQL